jgi:hypothetical protein
MAQSSGPNVTLAAMGEFARNGTFIGSATINRFEVRDGEIVAIGLVRGTLRRGNRIVGTVLKGEVTWPVALRTGGVLAITGPAPTARIQPAAWTLAQDVCPVLDLSLGPVTVNVLGIDLTLAPIALDLHGEAGTPLGGLVCAISDLLGNVVGLVNVLNAILGLLTGLLGGIGGLG